MTDLLERAERMWLGKARGDDGSPLSGAMELAEVAAGTAFLSGFGNVSAFRTPEGLVLVDTGSERLAPKLLASLRGWTGDPVHTVVYSHGHIDHVMGIFGLDQEAASSGHPAPRVVAHENVPARFDRYRLMVGYNTIVDRRQSLGPTLEWPTEYRQPDQTYSVSTSFDVGGERFELHHGKGETDDHTWTWVPARGTLCTGDLFVWASPNAGNPQKVQRYPAEWAAALGEMAALGAEILLPGHGLPILGADRVRQALTEAADLLDSLVEQTYALMNEGASIDRVIHEVRAPEHLLERPYLRPINDDPEFVVRNVWRLNGGWFGGNPAELKPARDSDLAAEIASLAGGQGRLSERARELAEQGDLRLAGHLAELAVLAAPQDPEANAVHAEVFERRAETESSLVARNIFAAAAEESRGRAT